MSYSTIALRPAVASREAGLVLFGIALLDVAAKVQVPFWPVPATMQTLALFAIALLYRPATALGVVTVYLAAGFAGIPVFTGPLAGPGYFTGPTAGFLAGFVVLVLLVQLARKAGFIRGFLSCFAVLVLADAICFALGFSWLAWGFVAPSGKTLGANAALAAGVAPFVLSDLVKAALAAAAAAGFHWVKPGLFGGDGA